MIRIRDISLPPEHDPNQLVYEAAQQLKISPAKIKEIFIVRRSVDARKKPDVRIIYTVDVSVSGNERKIFTASGRPWRGRHIILYLALVYNRKSGLLSWVLALRACLLHCCWQKPD